jgi:hypothetical protein
MRTRGLCRPRRRRRRRWSGGEGGGGSREVARNLRPRERDLKTAAYLLRPLDLSTLPPPLLLLLLFLLLLLLLF